MDRIDKRILTLLQQDSTIPVAEIGKKVGLSTTPCWRRIQKLEEDGVITKRVAVLDPASVNARVTVFVSIRTNSHNAEWLKTFNRIVQDTPEIMEAHRLAGENDYLLKVQVRSTREFDGFYKRLVSQIDLYNVTSNLSMETLKRETALPI